MRRNGTNRPRADAEPGLALRGATGHKRRSTYPEFRGAARRRLVVVALEVGGRWGDETGAFLHRLARGKALASPEDQRGKVAAAHACRWGQLLAVAAQGALAASLSSLRPDAGDAAAGAPPRGDVICDARWAPDS